MTESTALDAWLDPGAAPAWRRRLDPLINFTVNDFAPVEYVPPSHISNTHNQPRFGFTNDVGVLLSGSEEQKQEYVKGVLIGAMIILGVAVLWFLIIISLKAMGQKKVGFLAGRLVRPEHGAKKAEGAGGEETGVEVVMEGDKSPDDEDGNVPGENEISEAVPIASSAGEAVDAEKTEKKFRRKVWAVRGMFVVSGILVMVAGGLFYGKGVTAFRDSLDEVRVGIDLVQRAAYKTIELTEEVLQAEDDLTEADASAREVAEANEGSICGIDTETSEQIRKLYDTFAVNVDELTSMIEGTLADFRSDLISLVELTEDVDSSLDSADIIFYILIPVSVIIIVLVLAMLAGVVFASLGKSNCFTKCMQYAVIWPMFVFFLVLSWILATLFLVASLAGADFCVDPDGYVQAFFDANGDQFDGLIFGFIIYYVSGCTILPPGEAEIVAFANQLKTVIGFSHQMIDVVGKLSVQQLAAICNLTDQEAQAVKSLVELAHDTTHVLNRSVVGLRDVLQCSTFNPIYTTFVHDALCTQGVSGMTYIFSTTLVVAIFSMMMITFRAALYPIKEPDGVPASKSEDVVEVFKGQDEGRESEPENEQVEEAKPVIY
ncbi:hypothetical protein ACHAXT_001933 [Thalassiosira profunda]